MELLTVKSSFEDLTVAKTTKLVDRRQAQKKTIDSQVSILKDLAKERKETLDPDLIFLDGRVSGASLERSALDQMRDRAFRGEIDKVYVLSPD